MTGSGGHVGSGGGSGGGGNGNSASVIPVSFLLLASDGVWDVLPTATALDIVAEELWRTKDPDAAARALSAVSVKQGSVDDITVCVVWFI